MKVLKLNIIVTLFTALFIFSCSEKLPLEDVNLIEQEISANSDENFVTSKQAAEIAEKFLSRESSVGTRAFSNATVETIRDEENNNSPAMYVINYPEGGWVIVGASRDYFPVLAYNDEGAFNMDAIPLTGLSIWTEEVKYAIRTNESFADSTKAQIRIQWLEYEEVEIKTPLGSQTRSQQAMDARIFQLSQLYPYPNHWNYMNLDDAEFYFDNITYQNIINMGNSLGAQLQWTIVGIRDYNSSYSQNGPLMTTNWDQYSPFNNLCNGCAAGCAPVAIAQIMKYHKKPANLTINGTLIDWNGMLDNSATYSTQLLIRGLGNEMGLNYGLLCDVFGVSKNNIKNAISAFLYSCTDASHNPNMVATNINANLPVAMVGYRTNTLGILSNGHAWVCDGVKHWYTNVEYFVEYYVYNSYTSYYGYCSPSNPEMFYSNLYHYHMNWGEIIGNSNIGWFLDNTFPSGKEYYYGRTNFYMTPL